MRDLVVLSGPSGSGKSTAIKALEDLSFFCVDNLPAPLLPKFMELLAESGEITRSAVVIDVRERGFLKEFTTVLRALKEAGHKVEVIYLEADDDALVRRFSETRRRHPLSAEVSSLEGLAKERGLLKQIKAEADLVLDTSDYNVHELRDVVKERFSGQGGLERLSINIISFGYRHGIPHDADIVIDIRFLPNPYFVNALKRLDGTAPEVRAYVLDNPETREFQERLEGFLSYLIPLYRREGKSYLAIAVGCTGGRHRSVVIADALAKALSGREGVGTEALAVRVRHRDVHKV